MAGVAVVVVEGEEEGGQTIGGNGGQIVGGGHGAKAFGLGHFRHAAVVVVCGVVVVVVVFVVVVVVVVGQAGTKGHFGVVTVGQA